MQGKGGKNDANEAAAICEAASRPQMYFVPVKSVDQQSMLCIHRLREGFKSERTACVNRIRGLMAEFGLVFAQKPAVLRQALPDVIEDASNELGTLARLALQRAWAQWQELDAHLAWCDERIACHLKGNEQVRQAKHLLGVGPVTASAVVATVGDFKQFKNGAQFGAWLGLTPRQNSSLKFPRARSEFSLARQALRSAAAASRSVWAARLATRLVLPLITLPPVILVPGHRPSQLVKCCSSA